MIFISENFRTESRYEYRKLLFLVMSNNLLLSMLHNIFVIYNIIRYTIKGTYLLTRIHNPILNPTKKICFIFENNKKKELFDNCLLSIPLYL